MARKVFFTFHYQRDIMRVNTVRNHWLTKPDRQSAGYFDHSLWEESKKKGDAALEKLILGGLDGSSVTAVLIGMETAGRKWVNYEIAESHKRGNAIIGIYINGIKSTDGTTDRRGRNALDDVFVTRDGRKVLLSSLYPAYDWVNDDGYNNFSDWVEAAAKTKGK